MNQLFYNIAGAIKHQIRSEKRTTPSEVIVRGEQNKQNRNWLYFNFAVESSGFIFNNFITKKFKLTFKGFFFNLFFLLLSYNHNIHKRTRRNKKKNKKQKTKKKKENSNKILTVQYDS